MTLLAIIAICTVFMIVIAGQQRTIRRLRYDMVKREALATMIFVEAQRKYRDGLKLVCHETMECARQIVRSAGGDDLTQARRDGLCKMMDHFEKTETLSEDLLIVKAGAATTPRQS